MNVIINDITFNFEVCDEAFAFTAEEQATLTAETIGSVFTIDDEADDIDEAVCDVISDNTDWLVDEVSYSVVR